MNEFLFDAFIAGIDQRTEDTSLSPKALIDAKNVDISSSGHVSRRSGISQIASFNGARNLWSGQGEDFALFAQYDALRKITIDSAGAVGVSTLLTGLHSSNPISFHAHGGEVFFTDGRITGKIDAAGKARFIGTDKPTGEPRVSLTDGGLIPGDYLCAFSYVNAYGEESGLSPAAPITLTSSGGVSFELPPAPSGAVKVKLYLTAPNSEIFYEMSSVPAGLTTVNVGDDKPGKQASTFLMNRMPGGSIIRMFHGRAMVVRGDFIIFSEPFNYGLSSPRHNFIGFNEPVLMVEVVDMGVYVGTATYVYFLAGTGPEDIVQSIVSLNAAFPNTSAVIEPYNFPDEIQKISDKPAAIWLGKKGYSVGTSDGVVKDIQSDRIDLPNYISGASVHAIKTGLTQVISIVQS